MADKQFKNKFKKKKSQDMKWGVWAVIGAVAVAGVAVSVHDYMGWQELETKNYGQGWSDLQASAVPLGWEYKDAGLGVVMNMPEEWRGKDLGKFLSLRKGSSTEALKKVWEEELPGGRAMVHQRLSKTVAGGRVIVMETVFGEEDWGREEQTVAAVFDSIRAD